jgi:hypothetical protein
MDINSRDGDYLIFKKIAGSVEMKVILNPGFDIIIENTDRSLFGRLKHPATISVAREVNDPPENSKLSQFPSLINEFKGSQRLDELLKEYIQFMESDSLKIKLKELNFF